MSARPAVITTCPQCGERLTGGAVRVGWSPCICPPAWGRHKGHQTLQCENCKRQGWTTVRYEPHHPHGGGHPNRR